MSAATLEAAIETFRLSVFTARSQHWGDFDAARHYARILVEEAAKIRLTAHGIKCQFPSVATELIKGIRVCRQAYAKYEEDFIYQDITIPTTKNITVPVSFVNFDKGKRRTDV